MHGTLGSLDSLNDIPLHLALDNTGVGLMACDAFGRLSLMSPALQELFETPFEPVSEPFLIDKLSLYCPDGETPLPVGDMPLHRARRGEFVRDTDVSTRRADGSLVHLRCNAAPLHDDHGDPAGAVALLQDVTAETEAIQRAERLRKRVVQTINHEFRTPLAALLGHVELIQDHREQLAEADPDLATWLAAIERSGWRLRDLVCEVAELVSDEDDHPVDRRPRRIRSA